MTHGSTDGYGFQNMIAFFNFPLITQIQLQYTPILHKFYANIEKYGAIRCDLSYNQSNLIL